LQWVKNLLRQWINPFRKSLLQKPAVDESVKVLVAHA
jgi:hypothetical protein